MKLLCLLLTILGLSTASLAQGSEEAPSAFGHSAHGEAYDEGPRQRPWIIEGIGSAPFAVTSKNEEVQRWFDQGNTLLHSFWYLEAERAFRWCIKLDPDCAMAYWGLARSVPYDRKRFKRFLDQAIDRKHLVSERERRFIEVWEKAFVPSLERISVKVPGWNATSPEIAKELEKLILDFPDDVEAKALYALNSLFQSGAYAVDAVIQQVLAVAPEHPGAIHYRIHNWDSMELGRIALDSCAQYGRIASRVGHANHMPGHIYTKLGMWHEGAIWLDAATRVEKDYMQKRMVLPHHAWNYAHNRNFLAHAQSILGIPSAALQGARDLLNAPIDPKLNVANKSGYSVHRQGLDAMRRTLIRFERWDEILEPGNIPWRDTPTDKCWKTYAEALARIGKGELRTAEKLVVELRQLGKKYAKKASRTPKDDGKAFEQADRNAMMEFFAMELLRAVTPIMQKELEARLWLARNDSARGLRLLSAAAELEFEHRKEDNDPPSYPRCLYNVLGETLLDLGSARPALDAFKRGLEALPNNGYSWSGIARGWHALGEMEKTREAYSHMLHTWSDAEPGLRQLDAARALGLTATPQDPSPSPQRNYAAEVLETLGPNTWQPYAAPELTALDSKGRRVKLSDYRGKTVLLVFYLSDACVHCVEQLQAIEKKGKEFADRETVILAISSDSPEKNAGNAVGSLPFIVLSDDADHRNAIRFKSYDEFEGIELHSTNLIDAEGRLRWVRSGGDPFMNIPFLLDEIDRMKKIDERGRLKAVAGAATEDEKTGGND